jgi:GTP cyclohydrolase I
MGSPPLATKARLVLPSTLLNGDYHASHKDSPVGRTFVNAKEREALTASIQSSHDRRQPIDLDAGDEPYTEGNGLYSPTKSYEEPGNPTKSAVALQDSRNEAPQSLPPTSTRPARPYTLNPPIDFDGLSWPSKFEYPEGDAGP